MIIAIEGGDANGKQTQSKILAERLNAERIAFPDYTTTAGEAILGLLKEEWQCCEDTDTANEEFYKWRRSEPLNALVLQSLMTTNRLELLPTINKHVKDGKHIVFDRYYASGIVYGTLDGLEREWIERIQAPLPAPDLWILLDIPVEESIRRRPERRDRYEKMPGFQEKVREEYRKLFSQRAGWIHKYKCAQNPCTCDVRSWVIVDGLGTMSEVAERIWTVVLAQMGKPKRVPFINTDGRKCSACDDKALFYVGERRFCFQHLPE